MATKLLKLASEDRRDVKQNITKGDYHIIVMLLKWLPLGGQRLRDAETEEMIENMQTKLVELEQENEMLKNKVIQYKLVLRNQTTFSSFILGRFPVPILN